MKDKNANKKIISKISESKDRHEQLKRDQLKREHSIQEFVSKKIDSFTHNIVHSHVAMSPETNENICNSSVAIKKTNKLDLKIATQSSNSSLFYYRTISICREKKIPKM